MNASMSFAPLCNICSQPVPIEIAKTDAQGRTVHQDCYLMLLRSVRQPAPPAGPA